MKIFFFVFFYLCFHGIYGCKCSVSHASVYVCRCCIFISFTISWGLPYSSIQNTNLYQELFRATCRPHSLQIFFVKKKHICLTDLRMCDCIRAFWKAYCHIASNTEYKNCLWIKWWILNKLLRVEHYPIVVWLCT